MSTNHVVMLLYDIANNDKFESKEYRKFRKLIMGDGFLMIQESVYMRSLNDIDKFNLLKSKYSRSCPDKSDIRLIRLTEKQYNMMAVINGELSFNEKVISSDYKILRC